MKIFGGGKPICSVALILFITLVHFVEAFLLIYHITVADWLFPMKAFLFVCKGSHTFAGICLGTCAVSGLVGFIFKHLHRNTRIVLFMMQAMPVILGALWAIGSSIINIDAYGGHQSTLALLLNQAPRIGWMILYPIAIASVINRK